VTLGEKPRRHPYFLEMSEQALRPGPAVIVECLSCRHVGELTGGALTRRGIAPNTPIAAFVKRLRCSKCGTRSVLATRRPTARSKRAS
jgi:hypothetical protein